MVAVADIAHHVYFLVPVDATERRRFSYVGCTMWPGDRLCQHNGIAPGGVEATKMHRPWEVCCLVRGFPDVRPRDAAMSEGSSCYRYQHATDYVTLNVVEAAWQRPLTANLTRDAVAVLDHGHLVGARSSATRKLREVFIMLALQPWASMGLTLCFTSAFEDAWARKLPGFDLCRHVETRPILSFPHYYRDGLIMRMEEGPIEPVRLTLHQKQLIFLLKLAQPEVTFRRMALWAKSEFNLHRPPSETTVSTIDNRGRMLFEMNPDERDASTDDERKRAAPAGDAVHALKLMIALARELNCDRTVAMGLKRMIDERTRPRADTVCRFIWATGMES